MKIWRTIIGPKQDICRTVLAVMPCLSTLPQLLGCILRVFRRMMLINQY